ncbi:MAG TPA: hypothetical protein VGH14_10810 [Solirubrobacterales bacterium]
MTARLARLTLALYPLAYRRRYGEEMAALVEDAGASPRAVADLARGALRAHLRPEPRFADEVGRDDRLRLGVSAVLLCWVLFALAGLALAKTTEGSGFEGKGGAPGLLGVVRLGIEILAVVGSLAVALGAAPLVLATLRQARARAAARRATLLACGCVAGFIGATAALAAVAGVAPGRSGVADALVLGAWTLLALACGIGCALAARRGLFAIAVPRRTLVFAAACAAVVAAAMVGIAALTLIYLFDLVIAAPGLAGDPNGPLGVPNARVSLLLQFAVMTAVAIPAVLGAARAWRGVIPS